MKDKKFLEKYFNNYRKLTHFNNEVIDDLLLTKNTFIEANQRKNKIMIFGNGGSAAIASHFSVDLTKNAKIRCTNYNEPDLLTCFSNDFGYDKWVEKAIEFYADSGDILILISSSGKSKNIINAVSVAKKQKIKKIITFSGHDKNNPLKKSGDINFWIDSKAYNYIENIHQLWLLSLVDLIIGDAEYPA